MRMLLIAVVLIYGMELDNALYWYVAAGIAATWDGWVLGAVHRFY